MAEKPIDLARKRRIRALYKELKDLVDADPSLRERTEAILNGELSCAELEEDIMGEKRSRMMESQISLRLPKSLLERLEALVPHLEGDPSMGAWGKPTRSVMIRMAIMKGIEALEDQYGISLNK